MLGETCPSSFLLNVWDLAMHEKLSTESESEMFTVIRPKTIVHTVFTGDTSKDNHSYSVYW